MTGTQKPKKPQTLQTLQKAPERHPAPRTGERRRPASVLSPFERCPQGASGEVSLFGVLINGLLAALLAGALSGVPVPVEAAEDVPATNAAGRLPLPESGSAIPEAARSTSDAWWHRDVWKKPDRPFLFYGEREKEAEKSAPQATVISAPENNAKTEKTEKAEKTDTLTLIGRIRAELESGLKRTGPEKTVMPEKHDPLPVNRQPEGKPVPAAEAAPGHRPLESLKTVEALQAERKARLNIAIMAPTEENMARYQEVNAYMLGLAYRFALAFDKTRLSNPQYDWTATHPTANFVRAEESETVRLNTEATLSALADGASLVLLADPVDDLTPMMASAARQLAGKYRFGLEAVARRPADFAKLRAMHIETKAAFSARFAGIEHIVPDTGESRRLALTVFPALVLVPGPDAAERFPAFAAGDGKLRPLLVATGAVSVAELERRMITLLREVPSPRDNNPSRFPAFAAALRLTDAAVKAEAPVGKNTGTDGQEKAKANDINNLTDNAPAAPSEHDRKGQGAEK